LACAEQKKKALSRFSHSDRFHPWTAETAFWQQCVNCRPRFGGIIISPATGIFLMTPEERERMNALCIRIQEEKNHRRFEALLRDLNELIRQKELRFPEHDSAPRRKTGRAWKTLPGSVQKIVKSVYANQAETVEIAIEGAEDLFREIRIENTFNDDGESVALKQGAHVDVTFEADPKDTGKKVSISGSQV
jgi:hypothetical protein